MNFKGGSRKTTTSARLAQRLPSADIVFWALTWTAASYRAARRSAGFDLEDGGTLYDAIRYEDPEPIGRSSARPMSPIWI